MTLNASFNPSGGGTIVGLGMTEVTRECSYSATGLAAIALGNRDTARAAILRSWVVYPLRCNAPIAYAARPSRVHEDQRDSEEKPPDATCDRTDRIDRRRQELAE